MQNHAAKQHVGAFLNKNALGPGALKLWECLPKILEALGETWGIKSITWILLVSGCESWNMAAWKNPLYWCSHCHHCHHCPTPWLPCRGLSAKWWFHAWTIAMFCIITCCFWAPAKPLQPDFSPSTKSRESLIRDPRIRAGPHVQISGVWMGRVPFEGPRLPCAICWPRGHGAWHLCGSWGLWISQHCGRGAESIPRCGDLKKHINRLVGGFCFKPP